LLFYISYHDSQSTSEEAGRDIAAFVAIFFENFPSFKGRAFHMAGESYGVCVYLLCIYLPSLKGLYIPLFASAVYDQNAELVRKSLTPINLTSVIIGMYREALSGRFSNSSTPQATELRILSRW
jgi:carboxypeptidase C (cathepsin A)